MSGSVIMHSIIRFIVFNKPCPLSIESLWEFGGTRQTYKESWSSIKRCTKYRVMTIDPSTKCLTHKSPNYFLCTLFIRLYWIGGQIRTKSIQVSSRFYTQRLLFIPSIPFWTSSPHTRNSVFILSAQSATFGTTDQIPNLSQSWIEWGRKKFLIGNGILQRPYFRQLSV